MIADGATHFTELGPGKVLQGLIAKTAGSGIIVDGLQSL
jgi:[acyl-carrier-protein] S-malonyltransferase